MKITEKYCRVECRIDLVEYRRGRKFKRYSNNLEGSRWGNELRCILVCIKGVQTLRKTDRSSEAAN